jgi:phosphoglycolate phosphatase-like HAD superfamily hydrolase
MVEAAIIFDVDGVLLHLTHEEENAFFWPFETLHRLTGLSRDWDSYRVRNDIDIIAEILENHLGRVSSEAERQTIVGAYLGRWADELDAEKLTPVEVSGARRLLAELASGPAIIGIATANLREAARVRLDRLGLWTFVERLAHGADGGGAKRDVLARAIAESGLPRSRIVYVGDNLTDVDAALANGVHFIGFATDPSQRQRLRDAGAPVVSGDHGETLQHIRNQLGI